MIFFDFDGTIANVWRRYYEVFVNAGKVSGIAYAEYVDVKRALCKDDLVAGHFQVSLAADYYAVKKTLLEDPAYLRLDTLLVDGAKLIEFFSSNPCRILTNRRKPSAFYGQLENLGLSELVGKSIVLQPEDHISKRDYIAAHFGGEKNTVIGDAASEYEAAQLEDTQVMLVRTGLRDPKDFSPCGNVHMIEDAAQFISSYRG